MMEVVKEGFIPFLDITSIIKMFLLFIIGICIIGAIAFSGVIKPLLLIIALGGVAVLLKKVGFEEKYVLIIFFGGLLFLFIGFKTEVLTIVPP